MQESRPQHIRSFVMRGGHITAAQRTHHERLFPIWGIPYRPEPLDLQAVFHRNGHTVFEIGFGMGETTAAIAKTHPDWNILAIDVYRPGVGSLLRRIEQESLSNIRIIEWDAVEVLNHMIPVASLDAVHIYFPDPWPKKRHHKRRLIQPEFIELLVKRISAGGILHMATDWPDYADQMLTVCSGQAQLRNLAGSGFSDRPPWRPLTKFETRGLRLGHPVADLIFQKK
ncbi:MAG: tRNA (guanosine(46)-N7)-methyltransferase TrmB [Burkholderiaceae bacterium]|nr:tRNA (guanosine(46)-N7)-methyltransferase TrmB [Burkholderiaceae bacterium]